MWVTQPATVGVPTTYDLVSTLECEGTCVEEGPLLSTLTGISLVLRETEIDLQKDEGPEEVLPDLYPRVL